MKLYKIIITCTLLIGVFFNSCSDEDIIKGANEGDGTRVNVQLPFQINESTKILTRADADPEYRVYDLYVYVFGPDGNIVFKNHFTDPESEWVIENEKPIEQEGITNGYISLKDIPVGDNYIFAVANTRSISSSENFLTKLDNVENRTTLLDLTTEMASNTITRSDGRFLMTGYYKLKKDDTPNIGEEGVCSITENTTQLPGKIYLERIDAKIQFGIICGNNDAIFTPLSWKVVNVPQTSYLFNKQQDPTSSKYFNSTQSDTFQPYNIDNTDYQGFTFYQQESWKENNQTPSYADREKKDENNTYKYAPENATYVVLTGKYVGKTLNDNNKEIEVDAFVRYTIHLGNTNNSQWGNFITKRNTHYIYKVKVNGVKDIIVEVETNEEDRPGAEGDVIEKTGDNVIDFDAHYEAKVLSFDKEALQSGSEEYFAYLVKTPFTDNATISSINEEEKVKAKNNADWVRFAKNNPNSTDLVSYNVAYTNNKLLSIDELIQELKENKDNNTFYDRDGKARYTCFINEYYYDSEPGKTNKDLKLWKKFVNQPNRELYILCDVKKSADKQSSIIKAAYVISQRSIQTFYNTEASDLNTAWGVESIQETPNFEHSDETKGSDLNNGRKNVSASLKQKRWDAILDLTKSHTLQRMYQKAYAACMSRNRDLNGDGVISEDEIRWYLPTLNQYTGLFIGEAGISPKARLYEDERMENKWIYKHFISSYENQILWAEEGASFGSAGDSFMDPKKFYYRCARNLGIDANNLTEQDPQNYVKYNGRVVDLSSYMNPSSVRQEKYSVGDNVLHGTFDIENKPYKKFRVATKNANEKEVFWKKENNKTKSLCDSYTEDGLTHWRIPTMKEMALILANKSFKEELGTDSYITRTYFQFKDLSTSEFPSKSLNGRYGHAYKSVLYLFDRDNTQYKEVYKYYTEWRENSEVRCVKYKNNEIADERDPRWRPIRGYYCSNKEYNIRYKVIEKEEGKTLYGVDIKVNLRCVKDVD